MRSRLLLRTTTVFLGTLARAQTRAPKPPAPSKPKVFVTADPVTYSHWRLPVGDSKYLAIIPGPERDEVIEAFLKRCPAVSVTLDGATADFAADVEHLDYESPLLKRNKWIASDRQGDVLGAGSDYSIGGAVRDACKAITGKPKK